jgi:hypothetical protein
VYRSLNSYEVYRSLNSSEVYRSLNSSEVFNFFLQKLEILFRIRVVDGSSGKGYLPHDVEMPLLTDLVER